MGKDRQEKKLKQSRRVESDRDVGLKYKNSTKMSSPEEAMELKTAKNNMNMIILTIKVVRIIYFLTKF